ncbi:hypothetical protein MCEMIE22_02584 [Mycobacteriaceae bacterium]
MDDEIGSAAELFEAAELREVVMHQLVANREAGPDAEILGLPPEALRAPGSPAESVAMELRTRVGGLELGVRAAVTTRNAYAAFHVDAEAVFALPVPIATGRQDIVQEFIEQVGGPALFPYIRAAVASLAAQLSVPASPLPLLHSVDVELMTDHLAPNLGDDDHLPSHPEDADEDRYVHGKFAEKIVVQLDGVGTLERVERSAAFMIDTQTQQLVQVGDDTLDVAQVDFIATMLQIDPSVFWPHLREDEDSVQETAGDADLDEDPSEPSVPEGVLMTGTMTRTADDGSIEDVAEFFIDAETGSLVRVGGEGQTPDADEFLNALAELASGPWVELADADELTWQSVIRDRGADSARQSIEDLRSQEGDAVADATLDRMESALRLNAIEDAVLALNDAINLLAMEAVATKEVVDGLPAALVAAAESVVARWGDFNEV